MFLKYIDYYQTGENRDHKILRLGSPLGVNIPNYDDLRDILGFDNVFLGRSLETYTLLAVEDAALDGSGIPNDNVLRSYESHCSGCHGMYEMLGEGPGKLVYRKKNAGKCRPFLDPQTDEKVYG